MEAVLDFGRGCQDLSIILIGECVGRGGGAEMERRPTAPVITSGWGRGKAVNRGDKRTRRVRDRDFVKFERSCRYRDRYRCQEKKSRRG